MTTKTTTAAAATTTSTVPTLLRSVYNELPPEEQKAFIKMKGEIVENDEDDIESDFDMETEEETDTGKTSADYNLEGPAAFANIITTIGDKVFRLRGYKITELSACMDEWNSTTKSWGAVHAPTMNIIEMLRTHGADTINRLQTSVVEFRESGQKAGPSHDVIAELLAAEAKANGSVAEPVTTAEAEAEASLKLKLAKTAEDEISPFAEELSDDEQMMQALQAKTVELSDDELMLLSLQAKIAAANRTKK